MIVFQWLGLGFVLVLGLVALARLGQHRAAWRYHLLWLLLWLAAAVSIAWPDLTMRLAWRVGIGRGADLVFYVAILGALAGFFAQERRLRRLDAHITELTRHLAIRDALPPEGGEGAGRGPG